MDIKRSTNLQTRGRFGLQRAALGAATAALALTCAVSSLTLQPAHSQGPPPPPPPGAMLAPPPGGGGGPHLGTPSTAHAGLTQPQQISSCTGCHGLNLQGRKGFSPNLTSLGVLKEYNQKTFERVLNIGVTNDGGHVQRPMPVYHFPAAVSDKIYAYLKSIKKA